MKPRGRRLGQTVNPRDERGWMIPRLGTARRQVYDLMAQGKSVKEICTILNTPKYSVVVHRQNITKTARLNAQRYNASHDRKVDVPPSKNEALNIGRIRADIIEECARELETSYPDHAWLNAACAAIRSLAVSRPQGGRHE